VRRRRLGIPNSVLVLAGNLTIAACSFLRNIVIAHSVTVSDFGIAATFALVVSLIELGTDTGIDRQIVTGDRSKVRSLIANGHSFLVLRGSVAAGLLGFAAIPIARLFHLPHLVWAFASLALIPLIRGFSNLESFRKQRRQQMYPAFLLDVIPAIGSLITSFIVVRIVADYRAMLYTMIAHAVYHVVTSHLISRRRYRMAWDRSTIDQLVRFGWPLAINGLLVFGNIHADRAIVAAVFPTEQLGIYSAAMLIYMVPAMIAARTIRTLLLTRLARLKDDPIALQRNAVRFNSLLVCLSTLGLIAGWFLFPSVFLIAFGSRYSEGLGLLSVLASVFFFRLLRVGPNTIALTLGHAKNTMYSNLSRLLVVPIALLVAISLQDLLPFLLVLLVGEAIAWFLACGLLAVVVPSLRLINSRVTAILMGGLAILACSLPMMDSSVGVVAVLIGLMMLALGGCFTVFSDAPLRAEVRRRIPPAIRSKLDRIAIPSTFSRAQ
jgi:O-antigen/teichoic acid export membrane protein